MPSVFYTVKHVPMGQKNDNLQATANLPNSTPQNDSRLSQQPLPSTNTHQGTTQTSSKTNFSPPSNLSANPPLLPRNIITPTREMRESTVVSSGGTTRKPRQNLDERDHLLMVKHCCEQREHYKEGTKAQFWTGVGNAFQRDTGKVLAQMSATVGRLVESRRRQISDWQAGLVPEKPGGELNDLLDQWMDFLKTEDGDAEAERMRQVDNRRKLEEARKEARRHAISTETLNPRPNVENPQDLQELHKPSDVQSSQQSHQSTTTSRAYNVSHPINSDLQKYPSPSHHHYGDLTIMNGHQVSAEINGHRIQKRKRSNECPAQDIQVQVNPQQQNWQTQRQSQTNSNHFVHQNPSQIPIESTRKVIVEGQLTKEDWKEIIGNDSRLRALETKIEKIETLIAQNNKLLKKLTQSRSKDAEQDSEEGALVHQDSEFGQD